MSLIKRTEKISKDKEIVKNAFDMITGIVVYDAGNKPGEYIKRYGKMFKVEEMTAEHINKSFREDLFKFKEEKNNISKSKKAYLEIIKQQNLKESKK